MSCAGNQRGAFTLLEVILAVAMVAMVTLSIYGFLEGNLRAVQISTELAERDQQLEAIYSVLQGELLALPPRYNGALLGQAHKFGKFSSDELQWVCRAGNGLFTSHALGEYRVTLKLGKAAANGAAPLGVSRIPLGEAGKEGDWLPLLNDVLELRIGYFDPRLNAWVDKWTDEAARPSLVRLEILRAGEGARHQRLLRVSREARPES